VRGRPLRCGVAHNVASGGRVSLRRRCWCAIVMDATQGRPMRMFVRHPLEYDGVALATLFLGLGLIGLLALTF
jgi:hypothetical protein